MATDAILSSPRSLNVRPHFHSTLENRLSDILARSTSSLLDIAFENEVLLFFLEDS